MLSTAQKTLLRALICFATALQIAPLVGGCGGQDPGAPDGSNTPPGGVERYTVGPDGGNVTAVGGLITLSFPAGALDEEVEITVAGATDFPADPGLVSNSSFDFGPDGTQFAEPVVLTLAYEEGDIPSGVEEASLRLCKKINDTWEVVGGSWRDTEANTVSAPLQGFSSYGLVGIPSGGEVWTGNYTISSQDLLEAFQDISVIEGNLMIYDTFTETIELPSLTRVTGDLTLHGGGAANHELVEINLSALQSINQFFKVDNCDSLRNIDLPVCEGIGTLFFEGNGVLEDISGLSALRTLNPESLTGYGSILFVSNPALTNLNGLSGLSGQLRGISLRHNNSLNSLEGLGGISSLTEGMEINSAALVNLTGLALTEIGGSCYFRGLDELQDFSGLERLHTVGGSLQIENCRTIVDLGGLSSITNIGQGLSILNNQELLSLTGLGPVATLDNHSLNIQYCAKLTDLSALGNLQYIDKALRIKYCEALTSLHGLHNLTHVGTSLEIYGNINLYDLDGLDALDYACGYIAIEENWDLHDVSGLLGLNPCGSTGFVCQSFIARNNGSGIGGVDDDDFWAIVDDFGGETMVENEIVIEAN
jgi:hypothetical protein